jgi:3-deoxy-manno-octulosonate cytidylyltransferase (CMP-KDO synthetase)
MIDEAIMPLLEDPAIEVGTLVKRIEDIRDFTNPHVPKVVLDRAGNCLYFSRSPIPCGRDLAPAGMIAQHALYKHVGLYVFRRSFLLRYAAMQPTPLEQAEKLEQLRILEHGHRIHAVVTAYESVPVDTPEDLERVRALMGQSESPGEET